MSHSRFVILSVIFPLMIDLLVTFVHSQQLRQLVVRGPFAKPSLASFFLLCTRIPSRILLLISFARPILSRALTNTMSARALTIAFCPKLVALIASSANAPPNWTRRAIPTRAAPVCSYCPSPVIWMLTMFRIVTSVYLGVLVNIHMLLKVLQRVLRAMHE